MIGVRDNIILLTDSYKISHHKQYPPGTTKVYSYFESRGGKFPETVFFGLQYYIKRYLTGPIVTMAKIDEAEMISKLHFGNEQMFNREGWEHIVHKHHGFLPIRIKSVPEGSVVGTSNVLFTLVNTDPECFWLTNYLETLLVQVWYPMTVATQSREQKKVIAEYLESTGCSLDSLDFKLVDFGVRGVSCMEQAAIGGAAHMVNFKSTDNLPGIMLLRECYGAEMPGFSLPAAEHSTITSWGRDGESKALKNMLDQFPTGGVAVVSDSYNVFEACSEIWGTELKSQIENRDGTLLVRPDSGDPPQILCQLLDIITTKFGYTETPTGHKLLPPHIRIIQGDGISYEMIKRIMEAISEKGYAADNLVFGSGGALLQKVDRDTQKCAFKCSQATINGQDVEVYKDPITDPGKQSKKGKLTLEKRNGQWVTKTHGEGEDKYDLLRTIFLDGIMEKEYTLEEIKRRADLWRNGEDSPSANSSNKELSVPDEDHHDSPTSKQ